MKIKRKSTTAYTSLAPDDPAKPEQQLTQTAFPDLVQLGSLTTMSHISKKQPERKTPTYLTPSDPIIKQKGGSEGL